MSEARCNPHNLQDGEVLPLVGGPYDGDERAVSVLLPELDGGLPANVLAIGSSCYTLNAEKRQWEYMPPGFKTIDAGEAKEPHHG